jgi:propanol-preferring alcohol dehydrogenase
MATKLGDHQTAGLCEAPGPNAHITIRSDIPIPKPAADEVLIKLQCTGVCHSDLNRIFGDKPMITPISGHEGIGLVMTAGSNVPESFIGQRVGVGWLYSACHNCEICEVDYTACPNQHNPGRDVPGTYQQYIVAPAKFVTFIPEELKSEIAAPLLCAGITMYSAIKKAGLKPGDWVVIPGGGGGLGHLGVQICKKRGYRVIAVDRGSGKRDLCMRLGATEFLDFKEDDVEAKVKELTGGYGAHAVVCTAGVIRAYEQAFRLVRSLGTVVCVGLTSDQLPTSPREMVIRGLRVIGSAVGTASDMAELLKWAVAGDVVPIVEVFDFEQLDDVVQKLHRGQFNGRVVVRLPQ